MLARPMRYELGLRDDGWLVVDTVGRCVAEYGGIELDRLTQDEAQTMVGLLLSRDRGLEPSDLDELPPAFAATVAEAETARAA